VILRDLAPIVIAVVYLMVPADHLPSFFPGRESGVTRIHTKHGLLSGGLGVLLIVIGWFMDHL